MFRSKGTLPVLLLPPPRMLSMLASGWRAATCGQPASSTSSPGTLLGVLWCRVVAIGDRWIELDREMPFPGGVASRAALRKPDAAQCQIRWAPPAAVLCHPHPLILTFTPPMLPRPDAAPALSLPCSCLQVGQRGARRER